MWNGFLYGWFEKVDFIRFMSVDIWIWITIIHLRVCKLLMRTSAWLAIFLTINHATRNINRVRYVNMINVLSIFLVIVKRILELSMPFTVKMKFTQTIRHWDLIKEVIVEKLNHFSRWKNIIPRHFPWFYYTGTIWTEKLRKNACFTQFKYESQKRDNVSFFFSFKLGSFLIFIMNSYGLIGSSGCGILIWFSLIFFAPLFYYNLQVKPHSYRVLWGYVGLVKVKFMFAVKNLERKVLVYLEDLLDICHRYGWLLIQIISGFVSNFLNRK